MLLIYLGFVATIFIQIIYCQTVYELLDSLRFLNEGLISSSDIYGYQYEHVMIYGTRKCNTRKVIHGLKEVFETIFISNRSN